MQLAYEKIGTAYPIKNLEIRSVLRQDVKEQIKAEVYKIHFKERLGNKRIKRFDNSKGR